MIVTFNERNTNDFDYNYEKIKKGPLKSTTM